MRARHGSPARSILLLVGAGLLSACSAGGDSVDLLFPDQASRDATQSIAVTAFEPFSYMTGATPTLITCDQVGVFAPTRKVDPDNIANTPMLGRLLTSDPTNMNDARVLQPYPFRGDTGFSVAKPKIDSKNNPWGAALFYIEARGRVHAVDDAGQSSDVTATLLAGCYCTRLQDGSSGNRALDDAVKAACPLAGGEHQILLAPVAAPVFSLTRCEADQLAAAPGQAVSPAPQVCLAVQRCDSQSGDPGVAQVGGMSCFNCPQPCISLGNLSAVPVLFSVVGSATAAATPAKQVVLTHVSPSNAENGLARAQLSLANCTGPVKVRAELLGRPSSAVDFSVDCVLQGITRFQCGGEAPLTSGRQALAITDLPGGAGERDAVAILYELGNGAAVEVWNPAISPSGPITTLTFPGEKPRSIKGFLYDLTTQPASRPVLAVGTSTIVGTKGRYKLRIYEWKGQQLMPQAPGDRPLAKSCNSWMCQGPIPLAYVEPGGAVPSCDTPVVSCESVAPPACSGTNAGKCACPMSAPPQPCGCDGDQFNNTAPIEIADIDFDGHADLAVISLAGVRYYLSSSSTTGVGLYADGGCTCTKLGVTLAVNGALVRLGTPNASPDPPLFDLALATMGGSYIRYATRPTSGPQQVTCGSPGRFGPFLPTRDVAHGHFQCNPLTSAAACPYEDLVLLSSTSVNGSGDDPGSLHVVFGGMNDISTDQNLFFRSASTLQLTPQPLPGAAGAPRDPEVLRVADLNGDGNDDLAVLFVVSGEVHAWLGSGRRSLGEITNGIQLNACDAPGAGTTCPPLPSFALADLQGLRRKEVAVICDPSGRARLRWYAPKTSP